MTTAKDYRKHTRTPLTDETIYLVCNPRERVYSMGTITNMSAGGVCMQNNFSYEIGEKLVFEGVKGLSGARSAHVRWVISEKGADAYKMGLVFD